MATSDWQADAYFSVYVDIKIHTGDALTMEKGAIQNNSIKNNINTKSSTEAELVAARDVLSYFYGLINVFLKQQGYYCDSTFNQDNTSAILLEINGMGISSKRIRHINIRFYFIKDHIIRKELNIK